MLFLSFVSKGVSLNG